MAEIMHNIVKATPTDVVMKTLVKMAFDSTNKNFAKVNFELLCDIEVLYGLAI